MGQKVNPISLRLGINRTWKSRWYVDPREYADALHEDLALRKAIEDSPETKSADIAEVEIVRHPQRITVIIHTARPGVLIGAKGSNIEKLGSQLQKLVGKKIKLNIKEVIRPETHATLVAAAEDARIVPEVHDHGDQQRHEDGHPGHKGDGCGPARGLGDVADREDDEGARATAHVQGGHRVRVRGVKHELRHHWGEGLGLPRRKIRQGAARGHPCPHQETGTLGSARPHGRPRGGTRRGR
jgi:hypothetical protein